MTDHDAFGAVRSQSGASLSLGFTGQLTDPSTGFIDLRARELDPTLGRFLSADTVQPNAPGTQGYNLYAYTANNPTTWTDLSGHVAGLFPLALVEACLTTPSCAAPLDAGFEAGVEGGLIGVGGFPIIVFALLVCALDFAAEVHVGQSLFHGCFGLAGFYQYVMDQYGSSSGNGAYTGSAQDAPSSPATHPALPTTNDPA